MALICVLSLAGKGALVQAQQPYLVRDIIQGPTQNGSVPKGGVVLGGFVYFASTTLEHGEELWRSDGIPGGVTELVKDIRPGAEGSEMGALMLIDGTLYFRANDGLHGSELWKTDGTEAGTVLVADINPGTASSGPWDLVVLNGDLFFSAVDGVHGRELWSYDTSTGQAGLVKDINSTHPTALRSSLITDLSDGLSAIAVMNGKLYLTADDGIRGFELWTSDGTADGTVLLKEVRPGSSDGVGYLVAAGNRLYFVANNGVSGNELWCSDGTAGGTVLCKDIRAGLSSSIPVHLTPFGNKVVFGARSGSTSSQLWISDGTEVGTQALKEDVFPGNVNTVPGIGFPRVGGHLLFAVTEQTNNSDGSLKFTSKIWKTDGTVAGTQVMNGPEINNPRNITVLDSTRAIFSADDVPTVLGHELWLCDISTNTHSFIKELLVGRNNGLYPLDRNYFTMGSEVFFAGNDSSRKLHGELWKTDGTEAGTVMVHEINTSPRSSNPVFFTPLGNRVLFTYESVSSTPPLNNNLLRSDGTEGGTEVIKNFGVPVRIQRMIRMGDSVFICVANTNSSSRKYELWKSNGTAAGTVLVSSDIGAYSSSVHDPKPDLFTVAGNILYFVTTRPDTGRELWMSNGTAAGTKIVKDIRPGTSSSIPGSLVAMGNILYFQADDGTHGAELWKTNGTAAGTVMVKDIWPFASGGFPDRITVVGSTLFFTAAGGSSTSRELWKSDGTEAGTMMVKDIRPGGESSLPEHLTAVGDLLYFSAFVDANGTELWKSDGTEAGTVQVKDIVPGSGSSSPHSFTVVGNHLYFVTNDGLHGPELWRSDGTPEGTVLFADTRPGTTFGFGPRDLTAVGPWLFFRADDGVKGDELWRTDGTPEGTVSFDINPGPTGSSPMHFGFTPTRLFFSATTSATGREPFAIPISIPVPDTRPPTQKITSKGGRVKESEYDLTGTASDNVQVVSVLVSLNGAAPVPAVLGAPDSKGAVPFSLSGLQLENGVNEISVTTLDLNGNVSKTTTLTVTFLSNRPAIAGSYQGLLLSDAAVTPDNDNTGVFTAKVTLAGAFTGKVGIGKYSLPVRGIIDNAGHARFRVKGIKVTALFPSGHLLSKKVNRNLTLVYGQFAFEVDAGLIEGSLRDADTSELVSDLAGARAHFNGRTAKVPDSYLLNRGRYTAHLPAHASQPGLTASDYPQGVGFATASINKKGRVVTRGTLADGTKFTSSAALSETLAWPLFARLYKKGGALAGWVQADDSQADTDFLGSDLVWLRPPNLTAKHYPAGWPAGVSLSLLGAKYQRPVDASVLPGLGPDDLAVDGNATLQLSDGLLAAPLSHSLNIDARNRITNVPADRDFQAKISAPTGLLSGFFTHSDGSKTQWRGVIHQKGAPAGGVGYFLSTVPRNSTTPGQSGSASLEPND